MLPSSASKSTRSSGGQSIARRSPKNGRNDEIVEPGGLPRCASILTPFRYRRLRLLFSAASIAPPSWSMRMRATTRLTIVAVREASPAAKRNYELDFADASMRWMRMLSITFTTVCPSTRRALRSRPRSLRRDDLVGQESGGAWSARGKYTPWICPEFGRSRAGKSFDMRHELTVLASWMAAIGVKGRRAS